MTTVTGRTRTTGRRGTPAWMVIAATDVRLLVRNRTALLMATVMPLSLAGFVLLMDGQQITAGTAETAGTQLIMLLAFTVYATLTMTLVARRQDLYLKRLRSSAAATGAIVTGLAAPLVALVLAQAAIVLAATAVVSQPPARPELLLAAVLTGCVTCTGLAYLTAAFTRTPEAAQFTTFPLFLVLIGGLVWVNMTPVDQVHPLMLAVPGSAVAQLTRYGWDAPLPQGAGVLQAAIPALAASMVVAVAACYLAARFFRWEPRH